MTKRIFRSICLVALAILLACLVIIMGVLYDYITAVQKNQLTAQTELAAQGVDNEGYAFFDGLEAKSYRITWVDSEGAVLYDTEADAATMENHADREEIQSAFETGYGESSRNSETLTERQLYSAKLLSDGTVVRISSTQYTRFTFFMLMLQPIAVLIAVAFVLSLILASRLSRKIVKPLNSIDLDEPLSSDTYEELAPLLTHIEQQHREIGRQHSELKRKRDEFEAVTGSMNEGIVLLNDRNVILSVNNSAARLLNTDSSCVGRDMLTVNRSLEMQELLEEALGGRHAEKIMELGGGDYQLSASPVVSGGEMIGAALLLFDVTEKMNAEQMRREFTANVSHELKTPLHSILGCTEMIKSGMVEDEYIPQFFGQIYGETKRLITLVDDIIRLSRLDEGVENLPREQVDLLGVAKDVEAQLNQNAVMKNVIMTVDGERAEISGIAPLLRELVYNLCDNAVKYNRKGGRVDVTVREQTDAVVLTVTDTGIGIPEKHLGRIFERFYRVDKSHSKESGGTGLGLSIVKHVAMLHCAEIGIKSTEGEGTTITVRFPI